MTDETLQDSTSMQTNEAPQAASQAADQGGRQLDAVPFEDKVNHGVKERIDKLHRQYQDKINSLEADLAQLKGGYQHPAQQSQYQQPQGYQQSARQYQADPEHALKLHESIYEAQQKYDDFQKVVTQDPLAQFIYADDDVQAAIEQADNPGELLYTLLKNNREDIKNILKMGNSRLKLAGIAKLEVKLKEKPQAPVPPKPISAETDSGSDLDGKSGGSINDKIRQEMDEYRKLRAG